MTPAALREQPTCATCWYYRRAKRARAWCEIHRAIVLPCELCRFHHGVPVVARHRPLLPRGAK